MSEIVERVDIKHTTTVTNYVRELVKEGEVEVSRKIGKIPLYRIKKER